MFIYQGSIINNFLGQNAQQYKIPVYQRNYEWSFDQCDKLFEDIVSSAKRNQLHFCGSIVFQPLAPSKGIGNHIIIDGQQRLTTIYLLIKALLDMAASEAEKVSPRAALFNTDQFNQFRFDETTKVKLKPAKDNNDQLLNLLYDKKDKIDVKCEIYRNYVRFCELIKAEQAKGVTVSDIYRGISMLTVAVIQLDSNDKAQEIFERINSTGIPLSLADKIRNYVLMTEADQDSLYEKYWLKTEQLLTKDQLEAFFMDYLNLLLDGYTRESEAYDDFKEVFVKGKYTNESMLQSICHYAKQYHIFLYGDPSLSADTNRALEGLRKLKQTTVYLFLFNVFDDYENGVLDEEELAKILHMLLNYSIRRLICEIGSNSLRGLYKTLYSRVFTREENKSHYYDAIVSFLTQITSKDAIPSDEEFAAALKEKNLYRKNALCKFLLVAIENQGKGKVEIDELSIEHILPQNKNLPKAWRNMLGADWEAVQNKYLHTLGNLTLTAYNSEYSDKPFDEKKYMLENPEHPNHIKVLYSDVVNCDVWNETAIQTRANNLTAILLKLFPIEAPDYPIDFSDPRYREYTCDNPECAKFKTPNYYILQGERVNVTSYAEMLRSVIERLYSMDSRIIEQMAKTDECPVSWSSNVMFSYDATKITGDKKIKGTDIYRSAGFSASHIMYIIRALLDKYEIDRADFVYSARTSSTD